MADIKISQYFNKIIGYNIFKHFSIFVLTAIMSISFLSLQIQQYAKDLLEEYQKLALDAGVQKVEICIEFGSPKVKIPKDIAKKHDIDLIVCGATGLNTVERFFIGSVSEHIIRYAKCDVMVIRSDDKDSK